MILKGGEHFSARMAGVQQIFLRSFSMQFSADKGMIATIFLKHLVLQGLNLGDLKITVPARRKRLVRRFHQRRCDIDHFFIREITTFGYTKKLRIFFRFGIVKFGHFKVFIKFNKIIVSS